jgi:MoaA/NifB/PqqE/SkfB family radical SAM enzyme
MSCSHCLQQGLRDTNIRKWISTDVAKKAIQDAHFAGFTKTGLNFTGGEIFLPESNLPELLEAARLLEINVRINTNGWWGKRENIRVGKLSFPSPGHIICWLRDMEVAILALSFDSRFEEREDLWHSTVSIIRECELQRQYYQIIFTGVTHNKMIEGLRRLIVEEGIRPRYLIPVEMEMIDIGGAAEQTEKSLQFLGFAESINLLPCEGKGFYRPFYIHICPDGGVRSCLYAPGAGWLGNIYHESLLQIADKFNHNRVVEAFSNGELSILSKDLIELHSGIYRSVKHPCAVAAIVSKVIEQYDRFKRDHKREPSHEDQRLIHKRISQELNLNKEMEDVTI